MKQHSFTHFVILVFTALVVVSFPPAGASSSGDQWEDPFPRGTALTVVPETLTLETALRFVAQRNRSLHAAQYSREAAQGQVSQARRWPNPELEWEAEDVSGDFSGFRQSEMSLLLAQEFELWGKRKARGNVAMREAEATDWATRVAAFDVYAEVKQRFFMVLHAQRQVELADNAKHLAAEVAEAARIRVQKGAMLFSEQSLGELGLAQARVELAGTRAELANTRLELAALWQGLESDFVAVAPEAAVVALPDMVILKSLLPDSRAVAEWTQEEAQTAAQLSLERANGKPNVSLRGGLKRSAAEEASTFVVGLAIPLPLFDRNQGHIRSLKARSAMLQSERGQALAEAEAVLKAAYRRMDNLRSTRAVIDTLILPKAEETYHAVKQAYESGRLPYANLLEAERSLIDFRLEQNDLDLAIRQEVIALERLLGLRMENIGNRIGE